MFAACERDEDRNPVVQPLAQTTTPKGITCKKAVLTGKALDGGGVIQERGFIYMDNSTGKIEDSTTDVEAIQILSAQGTQIKLPLDGDFEYLLTGLTKETTYCVQAYVISEVGKSFGHPVLFTTPAEVAHCIYYF